ncbi:unnamed protein product [Nippostrongylus brasiliensis]|uniref:Btz domain-containing protein n=1 Tax=Nippostrongylus brasiliensis TaxID=27835 RepID=A0A158R113_NIPBR|nr:unnamed protein product [Nippostrongylus brasiliensis]
MNELEAPVQPSPAEGEKSVADAGNRKVPNKRHRQRPRIKSDSDVPKFRGRGKKELLSEAQKEVISEGNENKDGDNVEPKKVRVYRRRRVKSECKPGDKSSNAFKSDHQTTDNAPNAESEQVGASGATENADDKKTLDNQKENSSKDASERAAKKDRVRAGRRSYWEVKLKDKTSPRSESSTQERVPRRSRAAKKDRVRAGRRSYWEVKLKDKTSPRSESSTQERVPRRSVPNFYGNQRRDEFFPREIPPYRPSFFNSNGGYSNFKYDPLQCTRYGMPMQEEKHFQQYPRDGFPRDRAWGNFGPRQMGFAPPYETSWMKPHMPPPPPSWFPRGIPPHARDTWRNKNWDTGFRSGNVPAPQAGGFNQNNRSRQPYGSMNVPSPTYCNPPPWTRARSVPPFFNSTLPDPNVNFNHRNRRPRVFSRRSRYRSEGVKTDHKDEAKESADSIGAEAMEKQKQTEILPESSHEAQQPSSDPMPSPSAPSLVTTTKNMENNEDVAGAELGDDSVALNSLPSGQESSHDGKGDSENQDETKERDFSATVVSVVENLHDELDSKANRAVRVLIDLIHPDARSLIDCLGIPCSAFYRLCSQLSLVEFKELHELKLSLVDSALIRRLLEDLVWISRSILVPQLAEKALLADEHIDFNLRGIPEVVEQDTDGCLEQCMVVKKIWKAFLSNDRQALKELGVVDTAETISGKIELGMTITDEDVTMLLRDSMKTGFGEYSWLVENHPELIRTMEHFECLMESLPHMQECVDIRPLQRTMTIIPKFLASLNENDLASCVAKHLGCHNLPNAVTSWSEILRSAESAEKLSVDLITQFLFCSNKRGAEELLGALLENIPIEKRIMAIECIDRFPPCLSSELLNPLDSGSLYAATKRMTEEMPLSRFKKDAIFLIGNLCTHSSMSPSKLLTNVFFPTMSTASKGKAAVAISALINHDKFKQEVMDGSAVSLTDLLTFALEYYEAPMKVSSNCKYQFIESVISAVRELLSVQNPSVKTEVNLGEIFSKFQDLFHVFASSISDVYDDDQDWKQKLIELENEVGATQSLPNGTTTEVEDHHEEQGSKTSEESSKQHEIVNVEETAAALCSAIVEASQTGECTANSESKMPADDTHTEEKGTADVVAEEESKGCEAHESKSEASPQEEVQQRIRSDSLVVETGSPRKELQFDASGDKNQSAGDKVAAETETFDWDTLDGSKFEVRKEDILQDLRTFSWALNTIEKWPDCPSTVRDKVLFMASNCRCDLIKTRALEMIPKSS